MNRCETLREELVAYRVGELDERTERKVDAHLAECTGCSAELQAFDRLEQLLSRHWVAPAPSPGFASRFANRLAAEIEESEAGSGDGLLAWLRQPWLVPTAAAAAAVLLYLVVPWPGTGPSDPAGVVRVDRGETVAESANEPKATSPGERRIVEASGSVGGPEKEIEKDLDLYVDYAVIEDLEFLRAMEGNGPSSG